jgi:hypothetical protein
VWIARRRPNESHAVVPKSGYVNLNASNRPAAVVSSSQNVAEITYALKIAALSRSERSAVLPSVALAPRRRPLAAALRAVAAGAPRSGDHRRRRLRVIGGQHERIDHGDAAAVDDLERVA